MSIGGIILCGGKSTRMGRPKAALPFGAETMLARVVRLLGAVVDPIVVVTAPGQQRQELSGPVVWTEDRYQGRGPLEGLHAGLTALPEDVEAAYATSCDVPLLNERFVRHMIGRLGDAQAAVPVDGRFHHPLAAVYRRQVAKPIRQLLDADQLRPVFLYDRVTTCRVPVEELRAYDPQLNTLANLNRPEDYLAALKQAGFPVPADDTW